MILAALATSLTILRQEILAVPDFLGKHLDLEGELIEKTENDDR